MLAAIPKNAKFLAQTSKPSVSVVLPPPEQELSQQSMLELSTTVADTATVGDKEEFSMLQIGDSNNEPLVAA